MARRLSDGTLIYPRRGKPPQPPPGYEVSQTNKFVMVPKLIDCESRGFEIDRTGCCESGHMTCSALNKRVTRGTCQDCQGSAAWIADYKRKFG